MAPAVSQVEGTSQQFSKARYHTTARLAPIGLLVLGELGLECVVQIDNGDSIRKPLESIPKWIIQDCI